MSVCMRQRPEENMGCPTPPFPALFLWDRFSHWAWNEASTQQAPESLLSLITPNLGLQAITDTLRFLCRCWRFEHGSPWMHSSIFTHQTISPNLDFLNVNPSWAILIIRYGFENQIWIWIPGWLFCKCDMNKLFSLSAKWGSECYSKDGISWSVYQSPKGMFSMHSLLILINIPTLLIPPHPPWSLLKKTHMSKSINLESTEGIDVLSCLTDV